MQSIDESAANQAAIRAVLVIMKRNAADLAELADLVVKGSLEPRLAKMMSPSEAREAQELSETGRTHGKAILKVA